MNKIIKEDLLEILKRYKKAKCEEDIIQCVADYFGMYELINKFFPEDKIDIPLELLILKGNINKKLDKEKININEQIYENLDLLEKLYETILNEMDKYDLNVKKESFDISEIDFELFFDFFKNYGNMSEEFKKILDTEHLFISDGKDIAETMELKSINKCYVFISDDDPVRFLPSIAHEMGHVHGMNISYDDSYDGYHFLLEFMSILIEDTFYDYLEGYNKDIANYVRKSILKSYQLLFNSALAQVRLMKKHSDAFKKLDLNPVYRNELDSMINNKYNYQRDSLYAQLYAIDFILAKNYYYQLKYGNDFYEIEKFYIEHNCKNNLNKLLTNHVDIEALKQYLRDSLSNKAKKRSK